jgi:HlyD family secretion protein
MTTLPQKRTGNILRRPPIALLVALLLIAAVGGTVAFRMANPAAADPLEGATLAPATTGTLVLGVSATGAVEPRLQADLAFGTASGRVTQVLVAAGDQVAVGDPLVELDSRQLQAEVTAAEAGLAVARADLQALRDGATPEQLAEAQAQVAAAQGSLTQIEGGVTQADIAAAQAAVVEAEARLAELTAGPQNDVRTRAETALAQARADLDRQRSGLASAKEQALVLVEQRANAVRTAQEAYSTAFWDLEHVKNNETDPRSRRPLSDAEVQDFFSAFELARLNLADAEAALQQARVDYDTAVQNEISGLADAEARVQAAQADLDEVLAGADADDLAAVRAQLARAEAELARLTGAQRDGSIAAQQANLAATEARLAQLTADPRSSDLARAEARVAQAEAQLDQTRIRLEDSILRAPFAGVVAAVNVDPGESISAQLTPIVLIDIERYLAKVTVDEVDIADVAVDQPVRVLIDALGDVVLDGVVRQVEPLPRDDSSVTAYRVTIEIDPAGQALKPGMTASATIIAAERADTLIIPAAAVQTTGDTRQVTVAVTDAEGQVILEQREVEIGLRSGEQVEILSGLREGDEVVVR